MGSTGSTTGTAVSTTFDIVATSQYTDIRLLLGLDSDDTTTLPATVIEGRPFLAFVERAVKDRLTTWATIIDDTDADYDSDEEAELVDACLLWTASRLAALYFARRESDEVESAKLGPQSTKWRAGRDWVELARELADQAYTALSNVYYWGSDFGSISLAERSGPTRYAVDNEDSTTITYWRDLLWPAVAREEPW